MHADQAEAKQRSLHTALMFARLSVNITKTVQPACPSPCRESLIVSLPGCVWSLGQAHLEAVVDTVLSLSARLGKAQRRLLRKQLVVFLEHFLR